MLIASTILETWFWESNLFTIQLYCLFQSHVNKMLRQNHYKPQVICVQEQWRHYAGCAKPPTWLHTAKFSYLWPCMKQTKCISENKLCQYFWLTYRPKHEKQGNYCPEIGLFRRKILLSAEARLIYWCWNISGLHIHVSTQYKSKLNVTYALISVCVWMKILDYLWWMWYDYIFKERGFGFRKNYVT